VATVRPDFASRTRDAAPSRPRGRRTPPAALWLLAPGLGVLGVLFLYPLARVVALGATADPRTLGSPSSALAAVILSPYVWRLTTTTLALACWTTLVALALGYPMAYYLVRSTSRHRYLAFIAVLAPLMVSIVVRTLGWIMVLGTDGLANQLLLALRVVSRPVVWLYTFGATVTGLVHVLLPFMVLSIMAALARIDPQVEESARILGANRWRTFRHVTLPLSAQGVAGGCALVFSLAMGSYVTPALLGGGKVQVLATQIYAQMLEIVDWRTGALLSLYLAGLTLLVLLAYALLLRRAEAYRGG